MNASPSANATRPPPPSSAAGGIAAEPVGPLRRLAAAGATWLLVFLSTPGLGRPGGFGHVAFVALVPWALVCSRPGRRAFLVEWLAGGLGLALVVGWLRHVLPGVLPAIAVCHGLYPALAGAALRRLARRFPLALAVPAAWMTAELPRFLFDAPLGFGWWRLGTMAHDIEWLSGSARVFGVWGLSWTFAAFGGWVADLWRARGRERTARERRLAHLCGVGPLALVVALSALTRAPRTEDGPSLLLVQVGLEQDLKKRTQDPGREIYGAGCVLTAEGLAAARAAGEPDVDLVVWGETMLFWPTLARGFEAEFRAGARPEPWARYELTPSQVGWFARAEERFVRDVMFGGAPVPEAFLDFVGERGAWVEGVLAGRGLLPPGTSFAAGTEHFVVREGVVRRQNALALWDARGERGPPAAKVHLVPGAENLRGLERLPFLLDWMEGIWYVPDLVAGDRARVLAFETRAGRTYRFGASICYDNCFDDPYTVPLRAEELDFHLVASNEAWYQDSVEMDHMIAFSRLIAVMTGRSVVRATNSGISCVIDPRGRDVAVLEVEGRRKQVRGVLRARVPVPVGGAGPAPRTFYVRTGPWQLVLWALLLALLLLAAGRHPVTSRALPVSGDAEPERPPGVA